MYNHKNVLGLGYRFMNNNINRKMNATINRTYGRTDVCYIWVREINNYGDNHFIMIIAIIIVSSRKSAPICMCRNLPREGDSSLNEYR